MGSYDEGSLNVWICYIVVIIVVFEVDRLERDGLCVRFDEFGVECE